MPDPGVFAALMCRNEVFCSLNVIFPWFFFFFFFAALNRFIITDVMIRVENGVCGHAVVQVITCCPRLLNGLGRCYIKSG